MAKTRKQYKCTVTDEWIKKIMHVYIYIYTHIHIWGFSGSSAGKESTCNAGDPGSIPGLPTPVLFPGESQGRRSLVDCCLWGHTESDTTEAT